MNFDLLTQWIASLTFREAVWLFPLPSRCTCWRRFGSSQPGRIVMLLHNSRFRSKRCL